MKQCVYESDLNDSGFCRIACAYCTERQMDNCKSKVVPPSNLKPCPFCGSKDVTTGYALYDYNRWGVICRDCGAYASVQDWKGVEDTEENAIAAWNRRAE